jgi:PAS domain-containing protein
MSDKPTHKELGQRIEQLEKEAAKYRLIEEALRESERRYRNIYDNAQVGLYRSRLSDGKIVMANNRMAEIIGY